LVDGVRREVVSGAVEETGPGVGGRERDQGQGRNRETPENKQRDTRQQKADNNFEFFGGRRGYAWNVEKSTIVSANQIG
jgi:hypothetical protein